jgi:ribose 5-phosphate isomerase A
LRLGGKAKAGPIVTDNGNFIVDAPFAPLTSSKGLANISNESSDGVWDVASLATKIKSIVGVVETGLFFGKNGYEVEESSSEGAQKPVAAYFGMEDGGVETRT